MPNWCQNHLLMTHPDPSRVDILLQALHTGTFCETIMPTPPDVDAYIYRTNYWGTKWDITDPTVTRLSPYTLQVEFDSAWAPPIGVYETLAVEEGAVVQATFCELAMGFVGEWNSAVGERSVDVDDYTPDTIREAAGDLLTDRYDLEQALRDLQTPTPAETP